MSEKAIIGRNEWVKFPEFGISNVKARVDTGARSSSLHATDVQEFEKDGEQWVSFKLDGKVQEARLWMQKHVKSSNAHLRH